MTRRNERHEHRAGDTARQPPDAPPALEVTGSVAQTLICGMLGIGTPLGWSQDHPAAGAKTERLVEICRAVGAKRYLSGPSARAYIEPERFADAGITLEYMDYGGYADYAQPHGPFDGQVSILDLLFSEGERAPQFLKSFAGRAALAAEAS